VACMRIVGRLQPDLRQFLLADLGVPAESQNDSLLFQLQRTFWHLQEGEQQFFVPAVSWPTACSSSGQRQGVPCGRLGVCVDGVDGSQDMWRTYRHWGDVVNVREQQDANEFLNCFVDQVSRPAACASKKRERWQACVCVCSGFFFTRFGVGERGKGVSGACAPLVLLQRHQTVLLSRWTIS
jgi:hypothetical protein